MARIEHALLGVHDVAVLNRLRSQDPSPLVRLAAAAALERLPLDLDAGDAVGLVPALDHPSASDSRPPDDVLGPTTADSLAFSTTFADTTGRPAAMVPSLITSIVRTQLENGGVSLRDVLDHVSRYPNEFRPQVIALAALYARMLDRRGLPESWVTAALGPVTTSTRMQRQVAWLISRASATDVLTKLTLTYLRARELDRLAAVCLLAESAPYFTVERGVEPYAGDGGLTGGWFGESHHHPGRATAPGRARLGPEEPDPGEPPGGDQLAGDRRAVNDEKARFDHNVQFTVYRPDSVQPWRWYTLLAFAHRTRLTTLPDGTTVDPLTEVARQARDMLGRSLDDYGRPLISDSTAGLPRGDEIAFVPWLETAEINPRRAVMRWQEPVHRADFRILVPASSRGQRLSGGVDVYLGVALVGEVRFAVTVSDVALPPERADQRASVARHYRRIFASYSHEDTEIVQRIADTVAVTGDRYIIDTRELRSGEIWEPRLAALIEAADVFQLFWSRRSMHSVFVRREWEHALGLGREAFVRPVYWEVPFPETDGLPPEELRRCHFVHFSLGRVAVRTCVQCRSETAQRDSLLCRSCRKRIKWVKMKGPITPADPLPGPIDGAPTLWSRRATLVVAAVVMVAVLVALAVRFLG